MKFTAITLVLCACVWAAIADVAHIKAAKAKLIGRLAGKHHKRGILSGVPPFKLGHDIPHVTHSVLKPLVVTYPPTAAVAAVKIPVPNHHVQRFPVPVGHRVPGLPHPHYGLKFPHTKFVTKPDHHFHHHHHHVAPRPVVPVAPAVPVPATPVTHLAPVAPVLPAPQPTIAVGHPAPAPPVLLPAPVLPSHQLPLAAAPVPIAPNHLHLKPLLPAAAIPLASAPAPIFPLRQPFPYVIRPGGAVQTSFFATYPRFPLVNSYQAPLFPLQAPPAQAFPQILPHHVHAYQGIAQGGHHEIVEQHSPNILVDQHHLVHPNHLVPQPAVHVHPTQEVQPTFHIHPTQETFQQPAFHVHPTQETLHQPGVHLHPTQEILPQPQFHLNPTQEVLPQPGFHLHPTQEALPQPGFHLHPTQEALPQPGFHLHPTQETLPQPGFHVHPTQETLPQSGFHLHPAQEASPQAGFHFHQSPLPLQPTQPSIEHDGWSPVPAQPHDLAPQDGHFPQQGHHFTQEQGNQVYEHHTEDQYYDYQHQLQHHIQQQIEQAQYEQSLNNQQQPASEYGVPQQEFNQQNDYSQHSPDFSQHGQNFGQQGQNFGQQGQDFGHHDYNIGHPGQEYGLPQQGIEGRSSEDGEQQFHNHIPLGLQPPLDRPLDHFQ